MLSHCDVSQWDKKNIWWNPNWSQSRLKEILEAFLRVKIVFDSQVFSKPQYNKFSEQQQHFENKWLKLHRSFFSFFEILFVIFIFFWPIHQRDISIRQHTERSVTSPKLGSAQLPKAAGFFSSRPVKSRSRSRSRSRPRHINKEKSFFPLPSTSFCHDRLWTSPSKRVSWKFESKVNLRVVSFVKVKENGCKNSFVLLIKLWIYLIIWLWRLTIGGLILWLFRFFDVGGDRRPFRGLCTWFVHLKDVSSLWLWTVLDLLNHVEWAGLKLMTPTIRKMLTLRSRMICEGGYTLARRTRQSP